MKKNIKNLFTLLILLSSLLYESCSDKKTGIKRTISTASFKKAVLNHGGEYSEVKIIRTFPAEEVCALDKKFANLYVCKDYSFPNDTVYVFDECEKAPPFALDTSIDVGISIDKKNIKTNIPKAVTVFVPKQFLIPKNAKVLFASLTALLE